MYYYCTSHPDVWSPLEVSELPRLEGLLVVRNLQCAASIELKNARAQS
jgi:hypothetical protein